MADVHVLDGLDPYDLQDAESARLASHFASLDDDGWAAPSGCEGWSVRELLAHLTAVGEYFEACLSWGVQDLLHRYLEAGASSLDEFNAIGVANAGDAPGPQLLAAWAERNAANRAGFRTADGGDIDTMVGAYPGRLQAFHVAFEYAIHAQDAGAPVREEERDARQDWLAAVAQFALTEVKTDATVTRDGDSITVAIGDQGATVSRDDFVDGVSGRTRPGQLDDVAAGLLDLGY